MNTHTLPQSVGSLIAGKDVTGSGHRIPVYYPATGAQISRNIATMTKRYRRRRGAVVKVVVEV